MAQQESTNTMRTPLHLFALPAALLLAGCFAGEVQHKLEGERLNITMQPASVAANPAAKNAQFVLPAATALQNWGQVGAESAHTPGHIALAASVKTRLEHQYRRGQQQRQCVAHPSRYS